MNVLACVFDHHQGNDVCKGHIRKINCDAGVSVTLVKIRIVKHNQLVQRNNREELRQLILADDDFHWLNGAHSHYRTSSKTSTQTKTFILFIEFCR